MEIFAILILVGIIAYTRNELKRIEEEEKTLKKKCQEMYERANGQGQQ